MSKQLNICVVLQKNSDEGLIDVAKILTQQTNNSEINVLRCNENNFYNPINSTNLISDNIKKLSPDIVLFEANTWGKDIAPRVAVRLKTGLSADCTNLIIDEKEKTLVASRPVYNGQNIADIKCKTRPYVVTIKPDFFKQALVTKGHFNINWIDLKTGLDNSLSLAHFLKDPVFKNLSKEKIIVAGGLGVKNKESFQILEDLAKVLGGVVCSSRCPVDKGWRPHGDLVGLTGKVIKPKLYIACGISGANEHLTGITNSEIIIAINTDSNAPIFKVADYGIVGDLFEIVPKLIRLLKRT